MQTTPRFQSGDTDCSLLASRTVRKQMSVVLGQAYGNLLQQPQGTNRATRHTNKYKTKNQSESTHKHWGCSGACADHIGRGLDSVGIWGHSQGLWLCWIEGSELHFTHAQGCTHAHTCAHEHAYHMHVHTWAQARMCVHEHAGTHVHRCTQEHAHPHTCSQMHTPTCKHTHMCTHTSIHAHTCTHTFQPPQGASPSRKEGPWIRVMHRSKGQ